jgi:hypothetical protein
VVRVVENCFKPSEHILQCGQPTCPEVSHFKAVNITHNRNKERIIQASAGITFSCVLTDTGKGLIDPPSQPRSHLIMPMLLVFAFGSAEKGQLGNGTTGERITTGNKTAFDIEDKPSWVVGRVSYWTSSLMIPDSICQRTRWQEDRTDRIRTAA